MNRIAAFISTAVMLAGLGACSSRSTADSDMESHPLPDTLRVATLYSPASYFIYRDQEMGYDYSLVSELAEEKGMALDLHVAKSLTHAKEMLDSGLVDLIAYEVPITLENKERMIATGPVNETYQVLVQPKSSDAEHITDVTQLIGRDIYVEGGTKYHRRLLNLNEELGGGINIHTVDRDSLITEDLIEMVSNGEIPLTVVDSDIASINKTYYPDLDITMAMSFPQRSAWAVGLDNAWLADSINAWISTDQPRLNNASLHKRYYELSKRLPPGSVIDIKNGKVSHYDHLFKQFANNIDWDWRLLASQAYVESRFNTKAVSWAGARGMMQVMPSTARMYKVNPANLFKPEVSVEVASRLIKSLDKSFESRVPDPAERLKFIVAAYNSGPGHIYDAMALAKKLGKNPQVWDGNVAEALLLKSNPKYFNDPVVKFGYCRGRETTAYVREVMDFYTKLKKSIKD